MRDEVMPEGAISSDDDTTGARSSKNAAPDLADIDITVPLGAHEKIPDAHLFHREAAETKTEKKKKKKKTHKAESKSKTKTKTKKHKSKSSKKQPEPTPLINL